MLEIRWVDCDGALQLQQRTRMPTVDCNGAFCGFTQWSAWTQVPIHHGGEESRPENHVYPMPNF